MNGLSKCWGLFYPYDRLLLIKFDSDRERNGFSMRIVVVEDEEGSRLGLIKLIHSIDPALTVVGEAGNGEQGIEIIHKLMPDVVVTDIRMPVMDGITMIEKLEGQVWCKCHFIIISSYSDFEYARQALRFQVSDYLLKPITYEEVENIMFKLLSKSKPGIYNVKDINEVSPIPEDASPIVKQAAGVIQREYAGALTLENIAERLNISGEYLSQLFSRQMKVTLTSYLKKCRMEAAKKLLLEHKGSIQEVAAMVGYTNTKYFFKVFRDSTGVTPTEFMKEFHT